MLEAGVRTAAEYMQQIANQATGLGIKNLMKA